MGKCRRRPACKLVGVQSGSAQGCREGILFSPSLGKPFIIYGDTPHQITLWQGNLLFAKLRGQRSKEEVAVRSGFASCWGSRYWLDSFHNQSFHLVYGDFPERRIPGKNGTVTTRITALLLFYLQMVRQEAGHFGWLVLAGAPNAAAIAAGEVLTTGFLSLASTFFPFRLHARLPSSASSPH